MESVLSADTNQEYRVQITSKKQVVEQMNQYKELLKTLLDGQTDMEADTKRVLLEELAANFEAAVQANVLVKGQTWEEAPDAEDEALDLESLLDDTIVETTRRRRTFPKQILPHVVHSLKAQRKLMGLYEQKYKAEEAPKDLDQERVMNGLSTEAPAMVESAIQIVKSINTLKEQAQGLCQILNMKSSEASLEVHRAVFGQSDASSVSGSEDEGKRLQRREKNRVAAQKSRKRQTQRADLLHQTCELLEQRNRKLRSEVDSLSEEQRLLTEALRAHEPFCPIMHCSFVSSTSCTVQQEDMASRSV